MSEPQTNTTLAAVKLSMALTATAFDSELSLLIAAAYRDLQISGINCDPEAAEQDALILRAVITYCRMNFQSPPDYDKLSESYRQQKMNLMTATGFTNWGN